MRKILFLLFTLHTSLFTYGITAEELREREGQDFKIDTVLTNENAVINIVIMGDGYKSTQQTTFTSDAKKVWQYLLNSVEPFKNYKKYFNVMLIHVNSNESGITHPKTSSNSDCTQAKTTVDTYFGSQLDLGGIHRLIGNPNDMGNSKAKEILEALVPNYDIAAILCNSTIYGGSGGDVLYCTTNTESREIFVHELAHNFAALADEYYAGDNYLHEAPNQTQEADQNKIKWSALWGTTFGQQKVRAVPVGGSTLGNTWYKPTDGLCKMEKLGSSYPFCPVCNAALVKAIEDHIASGIANTRATTSISNGKHIRNNCVIITRDGYDYTTSGIRLK